MADESRVLVGVKVFSGNGFDLLKKTIKQLQEMFEIQQLSSVYKVTGQLEPTKGLHDIRSEESFSGLTVVLKALTEKSPEELLEQFEAIETGLKSEVLHRSVSVELFLFENLTRMTPQVTLPHPDFHWHPESVVPSAEVWGDFEHPVLKKSIYSLTRQFSEVSWGEFYAQGKSLLDF